MADSPPTRVFVITEGEQYYHAWFPHVVYGDHDQAIAYASQLVNSSGAQRWPNVFIWEFELNELGHISMEKMPL